MSKEEFNKLKVGDKVVVTGKSSRRIHHNFKKGTHITVTKISNLCESVDGYNGYGLSQWVSMEDIELVGAEE